MKKIVLFLFVFLFLPLVTKADAASLVINQVQVAGATASDEFIELYNPASDAVSISGWSIQYKNSNGNFTKKLLPEASVPASGYFLFVGSGYTGSVAFDMQQSSINLASSSGTIYLVNNTTTLAAGTESSIVDSLEYGSAIPAPAAGLSLQRIDSGFATGAPNPHNLSMSPQPIVDPTPTPTPDPTPAPTQDPEPASFSHAIVISEFMPNPASADSGLEWVEIYNSSDEQVDLSGWFLDDESADGSLGSSAYEFPQDSTIDAKSFLAINLPAGSFALDNTGGDTLRLLWPDKTLASQVSYTGDADENFAYALDDNTGDYAWTSAPTKGSENQIVAKQIPSGSNSSTPQISQIQTVSYAGDLLEIDKIFPNPMGTDSGSEWVEINNVGQTTVAMHGWILDDGEKDSAVGSSAYHIESPTLAPGQKATITIPAGKFAMNNSGGDTVRLFSPDKHLVDFVTYSDAKEGIAYAKTNGVWAWEDTAEILDSQIVINEIYPYPQKDQDEFIELLNVSGSSVDLTGWKLAAKSGSFVFPAQSLSAGALFAITRTQSGIALANTAKEDLRLLDKSGKLVATLEYEDAPRGQSLARTDSGDYAWTASVTQSAANKFTKGQVAGATLVRTGNPNQKSDPTLFYFALFTIIWYIAYKRSESTWSDLD